MKKCRKIELRKIKGERKFKILPTLARDLWKWDARLNMLICRGWFRSKLLHIWKYKYELNLQPISKLSVQTSKYNLIFWGFFNTSHLHDRIASSSSSYTKKYCVKIKYSWQTLRVWKAKRKVQWNIYEATTQGWRLLEFYIKKKIWVY